jgi:hypothetical protein
VPVVGSRFLIEAGFIIAVAVVAGIEQLGTWWIILVVAAAWILVAVVEIAVWARQTAVRRSAAAVRTEPMVAPEASARPVPVPPEPRFERWPKLAPEPEPLREPPHLAAVPPPTPEPEPEPSRDTDTERFASEPVPVPETARVLAFTPQTDPPREWNLWELERAARDNAGEDVAQAEERAYLLVYLREFAGPDGVLPADFDGLVRDAFGDVLHSVQA